jgi:single-stranded-DNA-specific exonuclease
MTIKNSFSLGENITPFGVAFYIAPYINAVTRCGTQEEKLILFESMLDFKAYEMINSTKRGCKGQQETRVEQACRNCTNIKNRQGKSRDTSLELIEQIIKEENLLQNKLIIVQLSATHSIDRNLTGLVATKIANEYQRPTLVLNESKTEDGELIWEGSGRNYNQSDFNGFRAFLEESGYVEYAEGHEGAFGVGILDKDLPKLINYSNTILANYDFTPKYFIDFEYDTISLTKEDILNLADCDWLWGQCIEEPYVLLKNVRLTADNLSLLKGTTIKAVINDDISLIKFKSSEEEFSNLYSDMGCTTINIVGRFQKNTWGGRTTPQILIEDYEIVDKTQYYF